MTQAVEVPGVGRLEFPDGMSHEDMAQAIQTHFPHVHEAAPPVGAAQTLDQAPPWARTQAAELETAGSLASGALAAPIAGLAGLAAIPLHAIGLTKEPADVVRNVQSALTYQPRTQLGQKTLGVASYLPTKLAQGADWAGGKATDLTGSPAVGAAVNTAIQALPAVALRGRVAAVAPEIAPVESAAVRAQGQGYVLPPNQARPTLLNNLLEGVSGKIKTQQVSSLKNQPVTQQAVAEDFGLPADSLNVDELRDVRKQAGKAYEAVRQVGEVTPGDAYFTRLNDIGQKYAGAARSFKAAAASPVKDLVDSIQQTKSFDAGDGIDQVSILRENADKAFRSGDKQLGKANLAVAQSIEDAIEQHLVDNKLPPALVDDYRQARQTIAKTYSAEKAMNPTTGTVDARQLAAQLAKGKPLTGGMRQAAEFAQAFPKAAQTPEQIGSVTHYSPLDTSVGIIAGAAKEGLRGNLGNALGIVSRAPTRSAILSRAYQSGPGRARSPAELAAESMSTEVARRNAIAALLGSQQDRP